MAIRQAPMADHPTIQPTMTVIIAQVGMGGICSAAAARSDLDASGQRGRFQLVHGDADDEALAVEEVGQRVSRPAPG